jgi:hypothetical protein
MTMKTARSLKALTLSALLLAGIAVPVAGQRPALAMLDQLESGQWELRERGVGGEVRQVCLGDPRRLIQLRHAAFACDRTVVDDQPGEVTVQYMCRGHGYGRTHIRRESSRLIQLDSQGIAGGLPFSFATEGRRISDCRG